MYTRGDGFYTFCCYFSQFSFEMAPLERVKVRFQVTAYLVLLSLSISSFHQFINKAVALNHNYYSCVYDI